MKKILTVLTVLLVSVSLFGCKKKETAPVGGEGTTNPVTSYETAEKLKAAAGIELKAPDGANNVNYFTIDSDIASVAYTVDGVNYEHRASKRYQGALALAGINETAKTTETLTDGLIVETFTNGMVASWAVDGVNHTLYGSKIDNASFYTQLENACTVEFGTAKAGMANPWVSYETLDELVKATGYTYVAVPEGAVDVSYSSCDDVGQIVYTIKDFEKTGKDVVITQRISKTLYGPQELGGIYGDALATKDLDGSAGTLSQYAEVVAFEPTPANDGMNRIFTYTGLDLSAEELMNLLPNHIVKVV